MKVRMKPMSETLDEWVDKDICWISANRATLYHQSGVRLRMIKANKYLSESEKCRTYNEYVRRTKKILESIFPGFKSPTPNYY